MAREHLARLAETLHDIARVVHQDPACQWRKHFESAAERADALLARGFTQEQLTELSSSVRSVYDASRRLRYAAPADAENFSTYACVAYERALELRAVGHAKA